MSECCIDDPEARRSRKRKGLSIIWDSNCKICRYVNGTLHAKAYGLRMIWKARRSRKRKGLSIIWDSNCKICRYVNGTLHAKAYGTHNLEL